YVASKAAITSYFHAMKKEYMDKCIRTTIIYPGPIDTEIFQNSYRSRLGQKYEQDFVHESKHSGIFNWLTRERCAQLFTIAICNQVDSCWIAKQPVLAFTFVTHYMPFLANSIWMQVLNKKRDILKQLYLK